MRPAGKTIDKLPGDLAKHGQTALDNGWVRPNKRIFNNAKISDHFAIIPTGTDAEPISTRWKRKFTT